MSDSESKLEEVVASTEGSTSVILLQKEQVQNVVIRLLQSRKFIVLLLLCLTGGVLVGMGKVSWPEFLDALKWIGGTFIASVALEDTARLRSV